MYIYGMSTCPFCDLKNNERNHILQEYEYTVLLMANLRKVPGQLLVIPKRHLERFSELSQNERDEIFDIIANVEKRLINHYKAGYEITQRYKPYLEKDDFAVRHLHFHVLPRQKDDVLEEQRVQEHQLHSSATKEEVEELQSIFKTRSES